MSATVGIVTGAGRGMGQACARRLVETVDVLVMVDRDPSTLHAAASELSEADCRIEAVALDVTDTEGIAVLAARVAALGSLRAVAHAAGVSPTMADWQTMLEVDLVGTARLIEAIAPLAVRGTAAVCFASMAAQLLVPTADPAADAALDEPLHAQFLDRLRDAVGPGIEDSGVAYGWAKRGVQRLVQRQAVQWGPVGARICSISPGMIDTPQGRQEFEQQPAMAMMADLTPVARLGQPDEIAGVVSFLLSDEAAFMTGCDVLVDGGVCAAITNSSMLEPGLVGDDSA